MIRQPLTTAARLCCCALLALLAAGCSTTRYQPPDNIVEHIGEDAGVDEHGNIEGTPDAVEAALAKLDAEEAERAVTLANEANAAEIADDLFDRMRAGFKLTDVDHETVDRETAWYARHPQYLDRTFRRGERYLYHIVQEIEARGMPLELALLPVVESAFNPVAYSRARASGMWQFIPETGRRYGLKQNWYYDGRRDVVESTRAALDYLSFLANEFNGDWLLAVAAYNCGEMAVTRAIRRNVEAGKPTDFFSLKLPRETRAYVPKLLAMRRLVAEPAAHGLAFTPLRNEAYFTQVETGGQIDLNIAAELANLEKEELLALNPGFNHWVTDPDGPHRLLVPVDRAERFAAGIAELPSEKRVRVVYHNVRRGDTLGGIASRYGVSVQSIRAANKLRGNTIHPGQDLLISATARAPTFAAASAPSYSSAPAQPQAGGGRHVVKRGETLWSISRRHGVSMNDLVNTNGLGRKGTLTVGQVLRIPGTAVLASNNPPTEENTQRVTYVVRRGDTLSAIADKFRVRLQDLLGWNNLRTASMIRPGQRLVMFVDDTRRSGG